MSLREYLLERIAFHENVMQDSEKGGGVYIVSDACLQQVEQALAKLDEAVAKIESELPDIRLSIASAMKLTSAELADAWKVGVNMDRWIGERDAYENVLHILRGTNSSRKEIGA